MILIKLFEQVVRQFQYNLLHNQYECRDLGLYVLYMVTLVEILYLTFEEKISLCTFYMRVKTMNSKVT